MQLTKLHSLYNDISTITRKASRQENCVQCGLCCKAVPCYIAETQFENPKACPALKWNGQTYFCDILVSPLTYFPHFKKRDEEYLKLLLESLLNVGYGCDIDKERASQLIRLYAHDPY